MTEIITLSDLEMSELNGEELTNEQLEALANFRRLRLKKLMKRVGEEHKFHNKFEYFRNLSNTLDYTTFLSNNLKLAKI